MLCVYVQAMSSLREALRDSEQQKELDAVVGQLQELHQRQLQELNTQHLVSTLYTHFIFNYIATFCSSSYLPVTVLLVGYNLYKQQNSAVCVCVCVCACVRACVCCKRVFSKAVV